MNFKQTTVVIVMSLLGQQTVVSQNGLSSMSLGKTKIITTPKEGAQYVFNSPDGKYICYSSQDLNKVYIRNLAIKNSSNQLVFEATNAGYFPNWSADSKQLVFRTKDKKSEQKQMKTMVFSLENKTLTETPNPLPTDINSSILLKNKLGDYLYINKKLELEKYNENTKQTTIFRGTEMCYQPVISPSGDKVVLHIGPNIWVYDVNEKTEPINLGVGLVSAWSPNGKYLLGFKEDKNDGHEMGNTDLYAFDVETKKSIRLTFTKKTKEINPSWSFDGKGIYYVNFETGSILYTAVKYK